MMSRLYAALFAAFLCIAGASSLQSFDAFALKQGRSYVKGSAEYLKRRNLYERVRTKAERQNSLPHKTWTAGVNSLWDWSAEELQTLRGWDGSARPESEGGRRSIRRHLSFLQRAEELPKEKIWSNLAVARHVKNQGPCGSCWAIAAASVLEAHREIYTGHARNLSAQQIVSCTPNPRQCGGTGGCQGATVELAMDWVMKNGCAEESEIPYEAFDRVCNVQSNVEMAQQFSERAPAAAFGMVGWETLPKNKYLPLMHALAFDGPAAVSVSASTWQTYESGIFNDCVKDAIIDHAVTAIGYGEENGIKYWLIQNSWGFDWGEDGHIRLERHDDEDSEFCGMNTKPEVGVGCKGETAPVPVCGMCGVLFDSVVPHFGSSK